MCRNLGNLGNVGNLTPNPQQNRLFPSGFNIAALAALATLPVIAPTARHCFLLSRSALPPRRLPQLMAQPSTPGQRPTIRQKSMEPL